MRASRPTFDPYRILGLVRAADAEQIKAAHRRLAKRYHPDGGKGDEQRFLDVQEAYQLLSSPLRRAEWDRRHAPGPVRADDRQERGNGATAKQQTTSRPRRSARDSGPRRRTWSAEGVPWWEDFRGDREAGSRSGAEAKGEAPTSSSDRPRRAESQMDFDVFDRSSGAAWSMAARRHFRKGDADLPSRGAWRYRGTQVVTGAEARKVAAEEAAAEAARSRRSKQRPKGHADSGPDRPDDTREP